MRRSALYMLWSSVLVLQPAQVEPAPHALGAPLAQYEGDFSFVSGVRELADGRLLVTDFKEPAIYLVPPGRGAPVRLGSSGRGPGEYLRPGGVYAGLGDTSLVLDRGQPRVIVIDGRGRIATSRSIQQRGTTSASDRDLDLQRIDQQVRSYFKGHVDFRREMESHGTRHTDSVPLLRLDPATQKIDTMALLMQAEALTTTTGAQSFVSHTVHFSPVDDWGVAADGRVMVVRARPYHVEWIGTDRVVHAGSIIPVNEVRVTERDRAERLARAAQGGPKLGIGGGKPNSTPTPIPQPAAEPMFASTKPPFEEGDVWVSGEGRVFVRRLQAAQVTTVVYDEFDDRGRRVDRFLLPPRSRVVGAGTGVLFVVTLDDDDLPHLGKFKH